MVDEQIPRDDLDETQKTNQGTAVGVGLVVLVLIIIGVVAVIYTAAYNNPPGTTTCSTTCTVFVRWECPGARPMGGCFGVSVCDAPIHTCGVNPP
jgi:hypothetical protein